ncbi:MAG: DUF4159 domain-containing protein [Opitutales bacterium]|nr:DUF4159 domain-containing protein [Opitutales bacterium]MCH8539254.1 DUF4159 domain-containing protein [Opitutales bacterium]
MKIFRLTFLLAFSLSLPTILAFGAKSDQDPQESIKPPPPTEEVRPDALRIVQLVEGNPLRRNYGNALPTLINTINEKTTLHLDPDPLFIESFEDERIFKHPLIYVNFADRQDWTLTEKEARNLRDFLQRGGFIYIDAGINAEFLRDDPRFGQNHSFADWEISPPIRDAFKQVFPEKSFERVPRSDPLFQVFFDGLPDATNLPDTVRDYVVEEKWPQGTYSFLGIQVDDRFSVLASPIIAMGWGRTQTGAWSNNISFRVRESAEGLSDQLQEAAYGGARFEATREDGRKDIIYCQEAATPSWVQEPDGRWRIFRYYHGREINDYAHQFYTQLGVNLFVLALTH